MDDKELDKSIDDFENMDEAVEYMAENMELEDLKELHGALSRYLAREAMKDAK